MIDATCSVAGCECKADRKRRGLCQKHAKKPTTLRCSLDDCDRGLYAKGLCNLHWQRLRAYGSTDDPRLSHEDRFWYYVDKTDTCWNWTGGRSAKNRGGYGKFLNDVLAHRFSYEMHKGPIPAGMSIDHTCHNKQCVNPEHLRTVTKKQNAENMIGATKANKTSGLRGVAWIKDRNKWQVTVRHAGRSYYGGRYVSLNAAEQAAIALRNRLYTHNDLDRGESVA